MYYANRVSRLTGLAAGPVQTGYPSSTAGPVSLVPPVSITTKQSVVYGSIALVGASFLFWLYSSRRRAS